MPFDGSGNFNRVRNWVSDALANIKIVASRHDSEDDNFASGLSQCLTKDGQTQPTADIPMNGKKLINLGTATVGTDAVNKTYADTADNLRAPIANPTFTGKVTLPTTAAAAAALNIPPTPVANPTTPVDGDFWPGQISKQLKYRIAGVTYTLAMLEFTGQVWTGANTFQGALTSSGGFTASNGLAVTGGQAQVTTTAGQAIGVAGGPAANSSGLMVHALTGAGNAAFMSFDRQGSFAANFGIDTDNNLKWGGWSLGANAYKILTENLASGTFVGAFTWSGAQTFSVGPTVPTAAVGTNTTQAASTAFVQAAIAPANAALAAGAVGTYALLGTNPGAAVSTGSVVAGSGLRYTHCGGFVGAGTGTPSGSWRAMGLTGAAGGPEGASVFLRVS